MRGISALLSRGLTQVQPPIIREEYKPEGSGGQGNTETDGGGQAEANRTLCTEVSLLAFLSLPVDSFLRRPFVDRIHRIFVPPPADAMYLANQKHGGAILH